MSIQIGEYVIVRCRDAGVHAGFLESYGGRTAELSKSRRLWRWQCAKGDFLSGVARHGLNYSGSRVGGEIDVVLTETCEIIRCTDTARNSIAHAPADSE